MSTNSVCVGSLPDGRLQLFAAKDDGLWTTWKQGTKSNSGWSAWSRFEPAISGVKLCAVAPLFGGQLKLFVTASTPLEPPLLGGPVVMTSQKKSADDSNSGWSDWTTFYPAKFGPPGSPATGVFALTVVPLIDLRLEFFMSEGAVGGSGPVPSGIRTTWQEQSGNASSPWVVPTPFNPPVGILFSLTAAPLSDGRVQAWGVSGNEIWTTYKESTQPDSPFFQWYRFQALPVPVNPAALTVGRLNDGRLQLWAAGGKKTLYTCWKQTTELDAPWTPWEEFISMESAIGGESDSSITSLAVGVLRDGPVRDNPLGPLTDGRLQLWALDSQGSLFSTWKLTQRSDSDWAPWSRFATP